MNDQPTWIGTANPNAVISRDELLQWLKCSVLELKDLIVNDGLPVPRFGSGFKGKEGVSRLTSRAKWRVGDIRLWLQRMPVPADQRGSARIERTEDNGKGSRIADELWKRH